MLKLPARWLWDFWLVSHGPYWHVFYLQAPRALGDPELRHANASIGHAVSSDLRTWDVLPDAISAGSNGAWDDRATWTGSILPRDGRWWMFYTGTSRAERGRVQRIGAAVSDDLVSWQRHAENPLITADRRYYETLDSGPGGDESWRDPYLLRRAGNGEVLAFVTARKSTGSLDGRGVIALACSDDLVKWDIGPPVFAPGEFGELEVPQVVEVEKRWYLLFSVSAPYHGHRWIQRTGRTPRRAIYYVMADEPTGPFDRPAEPLITSHPGGDLYSGKLVFDDNAGWCLLAARFDGPDGFAGELTDPLPIDVATDGRLIVVGRPDGKER
jgi:beta-fructofuranosidase